MPQEYFLTKLSPDITECVREVVSGLQAREATVVPVSLPSTAYALGAYHVVPWGAALQQCGVLRWGAGARAAMARAEWVYAYRFEQEVQKRVLLRTYGRVV